MSKTVPQLVKEIRAFQLQEINHAFQKTISYSQMSTYLSCPYKWKLKYKDKLPDSSSSVNLIFGTAMHETLQKYLTVMYDVSIAEADRLDLESDFHERFTNEYKKQYAQDWFNEQVDVSDLVQIEDNSEWEESSKISPIVEIDNEGNEE